ncbi:unknown protein [Cronobacter turicensis z3032]|uniref:Uncharacterized protein n=1 Tax=Cronobacter turicensis (strain DSM 18703 / CCUG 55852 / LMG 23827 / z3032) TaxID=693216 RepID=C9XZQ6_CROTZ|nr:unknown protein [Cronobacter turicensis z3032]
MIQPLKRAAQGKNRGIFRTIKSASRESVARGSFIDIRLFILSGSTPKGEAL